MRSLLSVTLGPDIAPDTEVVFRDRYAPYHAHLLGTAGSPCALRFNFSGLELTVSQPSLLNRLHPLCAREQRACLLAALRSLALDVLATHNDIAERLILGAYEAGYVDCERGCPSRLFVPDTRG
jgi:hypothetical protein